PQHKPGCEEPEKRAPTKDAAIRVEVFLLRGARVGNPRQRGCEGFRPPPLRTRCESREPLLLAKVREPLRAAESAARSNEEQRPNLRDWEARSERPLFPAEHCRHSPRAPRSNSPAPRPP